MRVLCVDDDPLWLGLLREMVCDVTGSSTIVDTVFTAGEALHAIEDAEYDLVIVDLTLCDMPGLELVSRIRARRPSVAVLTLSDGREFGEAARSRAVGAVRCLLKPLSASSFADVCYALGLVDGERKKAAFDMRTAGAAT